MFPHPTSRDPILFYLYVDKVSFCNLILYLPNNFFESNAFFILLTVLYDILKRKGKEKLKELLGGILAAKKLHVIIFTLSQ